MTATPSVPAPRRDMAMHDDWWDSGREHALPRQGLPLTTLIGTASRPGFTGSPDDLVEEILAAHRRFRLIMDRAHRNETRMKFGDEAGDA
ncbi:hypothetical protein [Streptomyces sp. NPDC088757]|uniref:hypothetical protein n=1 Tax=Streptomyces sp. NPDC088757 TaxID=3365889 RepID=UPI0038034CC2